MSNGSNSTNGMANGERGGREQTTASRVDEEDANDLPLPPMLFDSAWPPKSQSPGARYRFNSPLGCRGASSSSIQCGVMFATRPPSSPRAPSLEWYPIFTSLGGAEQPRQHVLHELDAAVLAPLRTLRQAPPQRRSLPFMFESLLSIRISLSLRLRNGLLLVLCALQRSQEGAHLARCPPPVPRVFRSLIIHISASLRTR